MRAIFCSFVTLGVLALAVPTASAQSVEDRTPPGQPSVGPPFPGQPAPGQPSIGDTATVARVEPAAGSFTVRHDDGREAKVRVDAQTRVMRGADTITLSQMQPGDRVQITPRRIGATSSIEPVADRVVLVGGPAGTAGSQPMPGTMGGQPRTPGGGAGSDVAAHPPARAAVGTEARALMRSADGRDLGEVRARESSGGLLVEVNLRDVPPGTHAFHVHEVGLCEAPFDSAGEHLSPSPRAHGFMAPDGPHAGDLVNLEVPSDGTVRQTVRAPDLTLADLRDADGAAFILHADADDYASQPAGSSGEPIACASIDSSVATGPGPAGR
jgi:Cu-Zn family superoxide dismutase